MQRVIRTFDISMVIGAKALLVAATLVCLASIGGAMLFAFPVLVPLHWLAARGSGPYKTGAWALLASLSIFEASWMITYVLSESAAAGFAVGLVAGVATATGFIRRGATIAVAASRSAASPTTML